MPHLEGREDEVSSTVRLLADPAARIVTLTGLPGMGTTSVARAAFARHLSLANPRRTTHPVAAQPFPCVYARRATTPGALTHMLSDVVSAADLTLVDDVDHSPGAADEIRRVLDRQPHTRLLVTARSPLHLPGEFVTRIPALLGPDCELEPEMYAGQPAVRIFLTAAARTGWTAEVDESSLRDIAAICSILGGNPRAIELAAARTPCLGTTTLLSRLRKSALSTVISDRHPTRSDLADDDDDDDDHDLFRTIRWSTSLLNERSRTLLACLSVFHSPVPLEAIESVTGSPVGLDDLSDLVDTHLVDPAHLPRGTRYVLPALVSEHAVDLLGARPERAAEVSGRHTRWALDVAAAARDLETRGEPTEALTLVTVHEADLVAALVKTSGAGDAHGSARLVLGLVPAWFNRGPTSAELAWVDEVTHRAMSAETDVTAADRVLLLAWRGALGMEQARDAEHVQSSLEDLRLAHTMAAEVGDRVRVQVIMLMIGASRSVPNRSDIEPLCRTGYEIARRCGDQRTLVWLLPAATVANVHAGNFAAAATFATESLRRARGAEVPLLRTLFSLMGVVALAGAKGDREVVLRLRQVLRPYRQVLEPSLPPWIAKRYADEMFGARGVGPGESVHSIGHGGADAEVRAAADHALDYLRTERRGPLLRVAASLVDPADPRSRPEALTDRERQVLSSLTSGATNKELSHQLGISAKTVMHHTSSIYRKLGVRSRSEAVAWAMRHDHAGVPTGAHVVTHEPVLATFRVP